MQVCMCVYLCMRLKGIRWEDREVIYLCLFQTLGVKVPHLKGGFVLLINKITFFVLILVFIKCLLLKISSRNEDWEKI